jgi:hypothetical protein
MQLTTAKYLSHFGCFLEAVQRTVYLGNQAVQWRVPGGFAMRQRTPV